jgi:hypothetical protein
LLVKPASLERDIAIGSPGGNLGPGAFDNDDARDLLDWLAGADEAERLKALEWIFRAGRERHGDLGEFRRPGTVVAAAAVAAAGLEQGEAIRVEITELGYEAAAVLIPESSPALACDALATLLIAAVRDGEWHQGWTDAGTAMQARQTTNQLASVFYRYQHRHDQELPLGY